MSSYLSHSYVTHVLSHSDKLILHSGVNRYKQSDPIRLPPDRSFSIIGEPGAVLLGENESGSAHKANSPLLYVSKQYSDRPPLHTIENLHIISEAGSCLEINRTGKDVVLRNLILESRGIGLMSDDLVSTDKGWYWKENHDPSFGLKISSMDGGVLDNVYAWRCSNHGILMDGVRASTGHLVSRENGGCGIRMVRCSGNNFGMYTESNHGYGLDALNCKRMSISPLWAENNRRRAKNPGGLKWPQNRVQGCYDFDITHMAGHDEAVMFDGDLASVMKCSGQSMSLEEGAKIKSVTPTVGHDIVFMEGDLPFQTTNYEFLLREKCDSLDIDPASVRAVEWELTAHPSESLVRYCRRAAEEMRLGNPIEIKVSNSGVGRPQSRFQSNVSLHMYHQHPRVFSGISFMQGIPRRLPYLTIQRPRHVMRNDEMMTLSLSSIGIWYYLA